MVEIWGWGESLQESVLLEAGVHERYFESGGASGGATGNFSFSWPHPVLENGVCGADHNKGGLDQIFCFRKILSA